MFTDIVGYSRLMHKNESLGFELLVEHRNIVRPLLARFNGTEIDTAGDGFVVRFGSALDAVRCALEIQSSFAARNRASAEGHRIVLRIGIHVSDVIAAAGDSRQGVYGDGVNIAARLQPLAPTGGICVSSAVHDQIAGRLPCVISSLGRPRLKGIALPLHVYSIELEDGRLSSRARRSWQRIRHFARRQRPRLIVAVVSSVAVVALLWQIPSTISLAPANPRVAVMPFEMTGASAEDAFIPEGLAAGLIAALSQSGVHVLAESSVAALKKSKSSPKEIGKELNIDRIVTARLGRNAGAIQARVSLVDTRTEVVLWSEDFEQSGSDLLRLKTNIAQAVRARLGSGRSPASIPPAAALSATPEQKDAYIAYLRGHFFLAKRTKDGFAHATKEFERAILLDPNLAQAYSELAITSFLESWYGVRPPVEGLAKVLENSARALTLDPNLTEALLVQGEVKAYLENDFVHAEELYKKAVASNPRNALSHAWYAEFLAYRGRFPESYREIETALEFDPLNPIVNCAKATMRYFARDYDSAISIYEKVLEMEPHFLLAHYWLGRTLAAKKDYRAALQSMHKAVEISGREPMTVAALAYILAKSGDSAQAEELRRDLQAMAKIRYVSPYFVAKVETALGHQDEAVRVLQVAVIEHANQTSAAFVDPEFDSLRAHPGFKRAVNPIAPPQRTAP